MPPLGCTARAALRSGRLATNAAYRCDVRNRPDTTRWAISTASLRRWPLTSRDPPRRCTAGKLILDTRTRGHRAAIARADGRLARAALPRFAPAGAVRAAPLAARPGGQLSAAGTIAGIRAHRTTTLTRAEVTIRHGDPRHDAAADDRGHRTASDRHRAGPPDPRSPPQPRPRQRPNCNRLYTLCPRAADVYDSEEAPSRSIFQHEFKAFLIEHDLPVPEFEAPGTAMRSTRSTRITG